MRQQPIKEEDNDFNSRESSKSRGEQQQYQQQYEEQMMRVNSNVKHQDESNYNIGGDPNESSYIDDIRLKSVVKHQPTSNTPIMKAVSQPAHGSNLDNNIDYID